MKIGLIYADWCVHCNSFKPDWETIKEKLTNSAVEIKEVEEQNLDKLKEIDPKLEAEGYPTIFKISDDGQIEYFPKDRERNAENVLKWLQIQPTSGGSRRTRKRRSTGKKRRRKTKTGKLKRKNIKGKI